jgi:hypothetical protein
MNLSKRIGIVLTIVGASIVILMLMSDIVGLSGARFGLRRQFGTVFGLISISFGLMKTLPRRIGLGLTSMIIFVTLFVTILRFGNPQWCRVIYVFQAYVSPKYEYGISPPPRYTGTWITWYPNGRKRYEDNYIDGKRDGIWISWHGDGNKAEESHYKDDRLDGRRVCWDNKGNVVAVEYYENGKLTRTGNGNPF